MRSRLSVTDMAIRADEGKRRTAADASLQADAEALGERAQRLAQRAAVAAAVGEQRRRRSRATSPASSDSTIALTGPIDVADIERSRSRARSAPSPRAGGRRSRRTASPACRARAPASAIVLQRAQEARRQRVEPVGDALVVAIGGEEILHQVVGADREEVGGRGDLVESATAATALRPSRRA